MDFLYHVTLNTGHVRKTYPHEVDKRIYFVLRRIVRDSLRPDGTEVMEGGYRLKTTKSGDSAIATVFGADGSPVITIGCSPTGDAELWRLMHETAGGPLATDRDKPPAGAYIADRIEIGAFIHPDALRWTGDLARCLGWAVIAPGKIR